MLVPNLASLPLGADTPAADKESGRFPDKSMSEWVSEQEEEAQAGRDIVTLLVGTGMAHPGSESLQKGATLVAELLVFPRSRQKATMLGEKWSSPPTTQFPRHANFIDVILHLQRTTLYPSDYSQIYNLKNFEHWDATRLVPEDLLGVELKHAMVTWTGVADAVTRDSMTSRVGKGYYMRKDFSGCRIFVLGDSHGSLHSMIDILLQMYDDKDAFNEEEDDDGVLKLQYNVRVIFLGDILDRSPYALDCLYLVLRLLRENPDQVVFIAGNHETDRRQWMRDSGSWNEMKHEYDNAVTVPMSHGAPPEPVNLDRVIFDVTKRLPAALIARTPVGVVQFNHGSFEPWLSTDHAEAAPQLNAFKRFATFQTEYDTYPTLDAFDGNWLQWGDLVTSTKDGNSTTGRPESTATELRDYLVYMHLRMLMRGHSDQANLSLVYAPGKAPSYELQKENSVPRLDRETWMLHGQLVVDRRRPNQGVADGGTFVCNFPLYDMWTLQPSADMQDFRKTLIHDEVGAEYPIAVTVSSCPFSRPLVPVEMMSAYLLIDGEF